MEEEVLEGELVLRAPHMEVLREIDALDKPEPSFLEKREIIDAALVDDPFFDGVKALDAVLVEANKPLVVQEPESYYEPNNEPPAVAEAVVESERLVAFMADIRPRLPTFTQADITVSVGSAGDKKVKVSWIAKNELGRQYLCKIAEEVGRTLLVHETKRIEGPKQGELK